MKKIYYNETTKEWYTEGNSLTRRVNGTLFSGVPSVEQLATWGFVEWVEPAPTPEELLEKAKQEKIAKLETYDASDAVNGFDVVTDGHTITVWFTPEQRADYKNSIDAAELLDRDVVHPVINGSEITLPVSVAKTALAQIQIYANQCYCVTEQHKAAINTLESVNAVNQYDYTVGYPERLVFNLDEI